MYRIHISVLKATKKTPLDKIRKKKPTWQDSQRIQVEFSIRLYRYFYGKLHIYTRFNQLEKNDSYKTFGLVAVLRLYDLLVPYRVVHTKSRWIELLCLDDSKTMLPLWKIIYKKNHWIPPAGVSTVRLCEEASGIIIWNWISSLIKTQK